MKNIYDFKIVDHNLKLRLKTFNLDKVTDFLKKSKYPVLHLIYFYSPAENRYVLWGNGDRFLEHRERGDDDIS